MPDNEKLNKLKQLLTLLDESITKKEFVSSFQNILNQILKLEKDLIFKIDNKIQIATDNFVELENLYKNTIEKIKEDNNSTFFNLKRWAIEQMNTLFIKYRIKEKISEIDDKLASVKDEVDGKDGKDADEEGIINKILSKMPQDKTEEILKEIEKLKEEIRREKPRIFGGAPRLRIIKETPSGTIDGSNTTFTISKSPMIGLDLFLNGVLQREGSSFEYTFGGKTITYNIAPPLGSQHYAKIYI